MGYCRETALPENEPVSLEQVRSFLRLPAAFKSEDYLLSGPGGFIQAAREQGELLSGRALAKRPFVQVLDSHPTEGRQAYPPSYYSLPQYSTSPWNYSQAIKLGFSPAISVERMRSINPDGSVRTMLQDVNFVLDRISEPARIFPLPGECWPADLWVANALQIDFTAGYDSDASAVDVHSPVEAPGQQPSSTIVSGIPGLMVLGILNLVAFWWNNRGSAGLVPENIAGIFLQKQIQDWAPTQG